MSHSSPTAVDRHLGWLTVQALLLVPFAIGQLTIEEWAHEGVPLRLLDVVVALVIGYFVVKNLRRLWLSEPTEASRRTSTLQLVVGGFLLLLSTGPLLESDMDSTRPQGVALLLIGATVVSLGVRDIVRMRKRRRLMTEG